jgi:predicted phage baseplate assembly protein
VPILPPALDDRSFQDLVDEVLARIPAHVPEWSNPRVGDPGRTLIELFAWLVDTMLYRANLVPEKQRLQFLRLLGAPMLPAAAARGLVSLTLDDDIAAAVVLRTRTVMQGPTAFETLGEVSVLPVTAACFYKRPPDDTELASLSAVIDSLPQVYDLGDQAPSYYVTSPVFAGGAALPAGLDLIRDTVDASLWIALCARKDTLIEAARAAIGSAPDGESRLLDIGFAPAIEAAQQAEDVTKQLAVPHVFEISTPRDAVGGESDYLTLDEVADTTAGLVRNGVVRLVLPGTSDIGVFDRALTDPLRAGLGDRPPRVDDAKLAARIVAWVRLRPTQRLESFKVSWLGINGVEIEDRQTISGKIVGQSSGAADQEMRLPASSVDPTSLRLQVEGPEGFVDWMQTPDLALAGRDDEAYSLDPEAGVVRFGDGMRGRVPPATWRVRVDTLRAGGGNAGNLPPRTIKALNAPKDVTGASVVRPIVATQGLPTIGGRDAESLADAERRIPAWLRHRDRAVTATDFREVAAETPGIALGRVEVMPKFKPQQRRSGVPGVVSVVVWPQKPTWQPPNPRADRPLIEAVHAWLDARRALATELYVIGCEYVPIAASVAVTLREGAPRDAVLSGVRDAIRRFLWPLVPGGADGTGWPLGRTVKQREIEVVVAQVGGVSEVTGVRMFVQVDGAWQPVADDAGAGAVFLEAWQCPELLAVIATDGELSDDPAHLPNPYAGGTIAVPVVPEVC